MRQHATQHNTQTAQHSAQHAGSTAQHAASTTRRHSTTLRRLTAKDECMPASNMNQNNSGSSRCSTHGTRFLYEEPEVHVSAGCCASAVWLLCGQAAAVQVLWTSRSTNIISKESIVTSSPAPMLCPHHHHVVPDKVECTSSRSLLLVQQSTSVTAAAVSGDGWLGRLLGYV